MIKCNMGKLEIRGIKAVLMADLHTMLRGLMESEILPYGVIKSILEVAKCETEGTDTEEAYDEMVKAMLDDVIKKSEEKVESPDEEPLTVDEDVMRMVFEGMRG